MSFFSDFFSRHQRVWVPLIALLLMLGAWRAYGLAGLALAAAAMLMFVLLHFTRLMHIMRRAADRPVGYVPSAVMLNAKLRPRVNLVHIMALTRSLGELRSAPDQQPEVFRWQDNTRSFVDCELQNGRLVRWTLTRPGDDQADGGDIPARATPADASVQP